MSKNLNALLRNLNAIRAVALIINVGAIRRFTSLFEMVCDMACLYFKAESEQSSLARELIYDFEYLGDEIFLKSLSDRCHNCRPQAHECSSFPVTVNTYKVDDIYIYLQSMA